MAKRLTVDKIGTPGGEAWLVRAAHSAVLVDTGFPFYGKTLAKDVSRRLGGLPLTDILVTHSHYDHAGGLAKIKEAFPDADVSMAAHAQEVLRREGALKAMRALNRTAASLTEGAFEALDDDVGGYAADRILMEGDSIRTVDFLIEAWETPGHTNDSLSFWFPHENLMALSETTGVFSKAPQLYAEPAFIVSWKAAITALERIGKLSPQTLIIPHAGVLTGDDVHEFLQKEREEILFAKDLVLQFNSEGKTIDEILAVFQSRYYDHRPASLSECQPLPAFLINFTTMISRILAEEQ